MAFILKGNQNKKDLSIKEKTIGQSIAPLALYLIAFFFLKVFASIEYNLC